MNARYKTVPPWGGIAHEGSFYIQVADVLDTRTGRTHIDGAHRVVDARKVDAKGNMKPAKVGKGGTVPFIGEMAWAAAERLLRELAFAERWERE